MKRQLAAILYVDVAGYSRLTGRDEEPHQKLDAGLNMLADVIATHDRHKVHEAGDAILAEFQSVTEAVPPLDRMDDVRVAMDAVDSFAQRLPRPEANDILGYGLDSCKNCFWGLSDSLQ